MRASGLGVLPADTRPLEKLLWKLIRLFPSSSVHLSHESHAQSLQLAGQRKRNLLSAVPGSILLCPLLQLQHEVLDGSGGHKNGAHEHRQQAPRTLASSPIFSGQVAHVCQFIGKVPPLLHPRTSRHQHRYSDKCWRSRRRSLPVRAASPALLTLLLWLRLLVPPAAIEMARRLSIRDACTSLLQVNSYTNNPPMPFLDVLSRKHGTHRGNPAFCTATGLQQSGKAIPLLGLVSQQCCCLTRPFLLLDEA